jgi:putative membrane protein
MLILTPAILSFPWMWLKLIFVGLLALYHLQCHAYYKQQKAGIFKPSSFKLRLFNELATIFLVAIVFLIIVRSTGGLVWGMLGLFIFAALLMGGVFIYKRHRRITEEKEKNNTPPTISNN